MEVELELRQIETGVEVSEPAPTVVAEHQTAVPADRAEQRFMIVIDELDLESSAETQLNFLRRCVSVNLKPTTDGAERRVVVRVYGHVHHRSLLARTASLVTGSKPREEVSAELSHRAATVAEAITAILAEAGLSPPRGVVEFGVTCDGESAEANFESTLKVFNPTLVVLGARSDEEGWASGLRLSSTETTARQCTHCDVAVCRGSVPSGESTAKVRGAVLACLNAMSIHVGLPASVRAALNFVGDGDTLVLFSGYFQSELVAAVTTAEGAYLDEARRLRNLTRRNIADVTTAVNQIVPGLKIVAVETDLAMEEGLKRAVAEHNVDVVVLGRSHGMAPLLPASMQSTRSERVHRMLTNVPTVVVAARAPPPG